MKTASITEAKNNLSALIDGLANGSPVMIMDRGRPVARLEPVTSDEKDSDEGRLARLVRQGLVRPRRSQPSRDLFKGKLPAVRDGVSAVDIIIEERREGR